MARRFSLCVLALCAASLLATGCTSKPGLSFGATWANGPKADITLGEYSIGQVPNPITLGTSTKPDPVLNDKIAQLQEQATALSSRYQNIKERLDNPATPPAVAANLLLLKSAFEAAQTQADAAKAEAVQARQDAAKIRAEEASKPTPLDLPTGGGILGIVTALGGWAVASFAKRSRLKAAAALEQHGKDVLAEADAKMKAAIASYDALPDNVAVQPDGSVKPV